jgi:hypothetical protein
MEVERMKKFFTALIVLMLLAVPVLAEEIGSQSSEKTPVMKILGIVGKGIAISQTDSTDFKIIKIGIGKFGENDNETNDTKDITIGLLFLDKEKYKLKNITLGNGTFSAIVYLNDAEVGSVTANLVEKDGKDVWVGTLTISGKTYNIYLLEGNRKMTKAEIRDKVSNYCQAHHEEDNCRGKIADYCENNPTDQRCLSIIKNACKKGLEDVRCRAELKDYCLNNTTAEVCQTLNLKLTENYCKSHPLDDSCVKVQKKRIVEYCVDHPEETKCVVAQRVSQIAENVRERVRKAQSCIQDPQSDECEDFCADHPVACRMNGKPPLTTPGEVEEEGD